VFTESVEGLTAAEKNGLSVEETEGGVLRSVLHCLGQLAGLKTALQIQSGV